MIFDEDDDGGDNGCPQGCRWGWLGTEAVIIQEDRDITQADVWNHFNLVSALGDGSPLHRCPDRRCPYSTHDASDIS